MMRRTLLLILLLLSLPAQADMYQDARNATLPAAMTNLVAQGINLTPVTVMPGFTYSPGQIPHAGEGWAISGWWGAKPPQFTQFLYGSAAAPITAGGSPVAIGLINAMPKENCFNNTAATGCNSALLLQNLGTPATTMVTSALTVFAETKATVGRGLGNAQGINSIAIANAVSDGVGMGAYIDGRRQGALGATAGMELRTTNNAGVDCTAANPDTISQCSGLNLGLFGGLNSVAIQVGAFGSTGSAREGLIFNIHSITEKTIVDRSTSAVSLYIDGTHPTAALQTTRGSGKILLGTDGSFMGPGAFEHALQFYTIAFGGGGAQFGNHTNDTFSQRLAFSKSRNTTIGSHTAVQSTDTLGQIIWSGSDGTSYGVNAQILTRVAGAVSTGVVPTRMGFWTTDTTGVASEAMSLGTAGEVHANNNLVVDGKALLGSSTSYAGPGPFERGLQVYVDPGVQIGRFSPDINPPNLTFTKSRNNTVGSHTAVVTGDHTGQIIFSGSDGAAYGVADAMILATVEGPVSAGIVPTKLGFWTRNAGGPGTEVLRITSMGAVEVTGSLTVNGTPVANENSATAPRVVFYGDSLTNSDYDRYVVLSKYKTGFTASGPTPILKDFTTVTSGYGGLTASTGLTYAPEFLDPYYQTRAPLNIALIWLGTNDISLAPQQTPATTWTRIQALAAAAKAKGFKVCVGTSISRVSNDTNLTTLNGLIVAGWAGAGIDCLVNFASDPNLAPNGSNYANLTYYSSDQIHLIEAGKQLAAAVAQSALNTYIATFTGPTPAVFNAPGGMTASALPASAGGGGLYMCVDSTGVMYKKAACP